MMRTTDFNPSLDEKHFLIVFPDDAEGGKALDLLVKDGKVYGVLYGDEPCTVASESQLKKLTATGIKWSYAVRGKTDGGNTKAAAYTVR